MRTLEVEGVFLVLITVLAVKYLQVQQLRVLREAGFVPFIMPVSAPLVYLSAAVLELNAAFSINLDPLA